MLYKAQPGRYNIKNARPKATKNTGFCAFEKRKRRNSHDHRFEEDAPDLSPAVFSAFVFYFRQFRPW